MERQKYKQTNISDKKKKLEPNTYYTNVRAAESKNQLKKNTHIFKMRISFLAALRTFLPSFFRNFLHVYIFIVVLSLALNISQNSSLKGRISQG